MVQLDFSSWIIGLHILFGGIALVSGSISALRKKGDAWHRRLGYIYLTGMTGVFVTAMIRSLQTENLFLLSIGLFSIYLTWTAWLAIQLRRNLQPIWADSFPLLGILSGIALIVLGFWHPASGRFLLNPVPLVLGGICLASGIQDFRKRSIQQPASELLRLHIVRAGGSLISAWTAFVVVNIHTGPPWLWWLFPTFVGSVLISITVRKYVVNPKKDTSFIP